MAESIFDKLNSMNDPAVREEYVSKAPSINLDDVSKDDEGGTGGDTNPNEDQDWLHTPIFKKLGEILYDTVVGSTKEYVAEAEAAGQAVTKSMEQAMQAGIPMEYFDGMADNDALTDIHQQIADNVDNNINEARYVAAKDPATVGGTIATGLTGCPFVLPAVTAPFVIHDIAKASERGQGGKATANLAYPILAGSAVNALGGWGKLAKLAPGLSKVLQNPMSSLLASTGAAMTDEGTRKWAEEHPGRAAFIFGGVDAIRMGKAGVNKLRGNTTKEEPVKPTEETNTTTEAEKTEPKMDKYGFEETEDMVKPQETKQKPKTVTEEAFPENMEENQKTQDRIANEIADDVLEAQRTPSVMQGAYGEELKFGSSDYTAPISINGIWKQAQKIAPAIPGRLGRIKDNVLGYFKPKGEYIRVKGFKSWSVLCHEEGHALSQKIGFGRGNTAIETELKNGALSIWKNGEYGDPHTPKGHADYIEEGRAAFMNEYLINPEQAKKHFPLTYDDLQARLANEPELRNNLEILGQQIRKWGNEDAWGQVNASNSYGENKTFMEKLYHNVDAVETDFTDELTSLFTGTERHLNAHPKQTMDKKGNITKTKVELSREEHPGWVAQRAKEAINAVASDLIGKSGIDTPRIMQAVAHKVGVSLHAVTLMDVFSPIKALVKSDYGKQWLKAHASNIKDGYEWFSTYITAKHALEIIKVQNQKRIDSITESLKVLEDNKTIIRDNMDAVVAQINEALNKGEDIVPLQGRYTELNTKLNELLFKEQELNKTKTNIEAGKDDYLTPDERQKYEIIVNEGDKVPELVQAADLLRKFNENILRIAVAGDMLKAKEAQAFLKTYQNYVPFMRSFAIEGQEHAKIKAIASGDSGYVNIHKAFKALSEEGSERTINDPIAQYALNVASLVSKIERNKVAKAVLNLGEKTGAAILEPADTGGNAVPNERIVTVWHDGVQSAYHVNNTEFYDGLMHANKAVQVLQLNFLEAISQGAATTLRKCATFTWAFAAANIIKDLLTATCLNKDGRKTYLPVVDQAWLLFDGVLGMRDKQMRAEYKTEGIQYTTSIGQSRQINANMREYINDTAFRLSKMGRVLDIIMSVTDIGEQLPRMGLYRRARLRGASPFEAACIASDGTVNFMRSGTVGKGLNRHIPFFNAVLQGGSKVWRSFKEDPVGCSLCCFNYLTLPALLAWYQSHDKDWYKNTPLSVKNKYIMFDVSSAQDGSKVLKVPVPEFIGYLFCSVPARTLDFAVDNDRDGKVLNQVMHDTVAQLAPSMQLALILPMVEWASNYSFFRDRPIDDMRMMKRKPEDRYNIYTSEIAKWVGAKTGQSPMRIDNTIYDLTGTAGYLGTGIMDWIVHAANNDPVERPSRKWTEYIRFTYTDGTAKSRSSDVFHEGLERLEQEYGSAVMHAGNVSRKPDVSEELKDMRRASKKADDLTHDINLLNDMEMTGDEKRAEIDKLVKERDNIYRFANKKNLGYTYIQSPEENPYPQKTKKKKTPYSLLAPKKKKKSNTGADKWKKK